MDAEYALAHDLIEVYRTQSVDQLNETLGSISFDLEMIEPQITEEQEKRAKWKVENERRRHNYIPAIFELLKHLAKKDMLEDMYTDATKKKEQKMAAKGKAWLIEKLTKTYLLIVWCWCCEK